MRAVSFCVILALATALGCGPAPEREAKTFHSAVAPAPQPGTIFIHPERIRLRDGGFASIERGTMFVPLNRSVTDSDVIGIEIYRFPASESAEPGTSPIFFLHGGPSFAGLEHALEEPGTYEDRWRPLTDVSDVVVVGQRGIGSSKPTTTIDLGCFGKVMASR